MRCLGPAVVAVDVEAREVDQRGTEDEELRSPYVDEDVLDVGAWPTTRWRSRCRSSCSAAPIARASVRFAASRSTTRDPGAHDHPAEPDPRFAKLRELLD